jgi:hypothetical protein
MASTANRDGVAARFPHPAVQQRLAVDLALLGPYDPRLRDVELAGLTTATPHAAHTRSRRRPVPGSGALLRLVRLDELQHLARFPRGHALVSSGRLVKWAKASAGKRSGTSGTQLGHASRKWAVSAAAGLVRRNQLAGQHSLARVENTHGQGQALTGLAHQLARAVYDLWQRGVACARTAVLQSEGRGVGAPAASLGHAGLAWPPCAARRHPVRRRTPMSP